MDGSGYGFMSFSLSVAPVASGGCSLWPSHGSSWRLKAASSQQGICHIRVLSFPAMENRLLWLWGHTYLTLGCCGSLAAPGATESLQLRSPL